MSLRTARPDRFSTVRPAWRLALALGAAAGYALLSHWLMLHAADRPWAIAALLGPLLAAGLGVALRTRHWPSVAAAVLAAAMLVSIVARGGLGSVNRLYLLQHVGIHLALFLTFAATLRRGRQSLIGSVAARVHGGLTPPMARYTRKLTAVWAGYFLGMALLSLAVHATRPWSDWSLLANVLTPVAIAVLFVGEHLLRYRLHPEFERSGLLDTVRAYSRAPAAPGATGR